MNQKMEANRRVLNNSDLESAPQFEYEGGATTVYEDDDYSAPGKNKSCNVISNFIFIFVPMCMLTAMLYQMSMNVKNVSDGNTDLKAQLL